nr:NAD(+) kinase [Lachnospiraceae bacterium]
RSDGLIVCTPTGSTAYSMSAGGPIIEPTARMMVITPVCPHTLNTRSIVLSPESSIKIISRTADNTVVFDGHNQISVKENDYVEIRPSRKVTRILRIGQESFLSLLSQKFNS